MNFILFKHSKSENSENSDSFYTKTNSVNTLKSFGRSNLIYTIEFDGVCLKYRVRGIIGLLFKVITGEKSLCMRITSLLGIKVKSLLGVQLVQLYSAENSPRIGEEEVESLPWLILFRGKESISSKIQEIVIINIASKHQNGSSDKGSD